MTISVPARVRVSHTGRVLIARYKTDLVAGYLHAALGLQARLLQAAEEGERKGSVIKILILQPLAHQAQDNEPYALAVLERALVLAEPEGYVRILVDEGEAMRLLIAGFRLIIKKPSPQDAHPLRGYMERLLAAFPQSREANPKSEIRNDRAFERTRAGSAQTATKRIKRS